MFSLSFLKHDEHHHDRSLNLRHDLKTCKKISNKHDLLALPSSVLKTSLLFEKYFDRQC